MLYRYTYGQSKSQRTKSVILGSNKVSPNFLDIFPQFNCRSYTFMLGEKAQWA